MAGQLLVPGSVYAFLAEHRSVLFPDGMFADLFPSKRGRPSVPGDVVATVLAGLTKIMSTRRLVGWCCRR